jgi:hypothetical protein
MPIPSKIKPFQVKRSVGLRGRIPLQIRSNSVFGQRIALTVKIPTALQRTKRSRILAFIDLDTIDSHGLDIERIDVDIRHRSRAPRAGARA